MPAHAAAAASGRTLLDRERAGTRASPRGEQPTDVLVMQPTDVLVMSDRRGKCLPVTQTELRLVFKHAPQLGFVALRACGSRRSGRDRDGGAGTYASFVPHPVSGEPVVSRDSGRGYATPAARGVGSMNPPMIHRIGKKNPIQNIQ